MTTSLPETIGGERNWDYRYSWVRDSVFTVEALLRSGCAAEATSFFWWLLHATQITQPRMQVLYRLDGGRGMRERRLELDGYRSSRPVRVGNAAESQTQLDIYGHLVQTSWLYGREHRLDRDTGRRLRKIADLVCGLWQQPDAGIWESRGEPRHHTQSKMMCWVALDRAAQLADAGTIKGDASRWRREADAVRTFVEQRCWSERKRAYVRFAGSEELDASVLLGVLLGYNGSDDPRVPTTIAALRAELGSGPLLRRYDGDDGVGGRDAPFLACSFWLVDALARIGALDEAVALMSELLALANDVGLYAEEMDVETREFLGNMPQGLVHLALVNAAATIAGSTR